MAFDYKEVDQEGFYILDVISDAGKFNKWMYDTIRPYNTGKILEIGSGVGNISQFFVRDNADITVSDIRENYRHILQQKFSLPDDKVIDIDIAHPDFANEYPTLIGVFDSVFCLNVVEHIENDALAAKNLALLLKKGGHLTVLVPAYQSLYNGFDKTLEHYRRYTKATLNKIMAPNGAVQHTFYFNFVGIFGWWVSGKLFGNKSIPEGEMKLYNTLVPAIKLIDKLTFKKMGLSVISVLKK